MLPANYRYTFGPSTTRLVDGPVDRAGLIQYLGITLGEFSNVDGVEGITFTVNAADGGADVTPIRPAIVVAVYAAAAPDSDADPKSFVERSALRGIIDVPAEGDGP